MPYAISPKVEIDGCKTVPQYPSIYPVLERPQFPLNELTECSCVTPRIANSRIDGPFAYNKSRKPNHAFINLGNNRS